MAAVVVAPDDLSANDRRSDDFRAWLNLDRSSNMCSTPCVAMTPGERQFMAGYNAGRTIALQTGSAAAGHRWLAEHSEADSAFIAGYEWALWDYEDANGLVHGSRTSAISG